MKVEVRDNGRLEIRLTLTESERPVQKVALETLEVALKRGQTVKVEATNEGIALVVEG